MEEVFPFSNIESKEESRQDLFENIFEAEMNLRDQAKGGVINETNQGSQIEGDDEVGPIEGHDQSSPHELDHNEGDFGLHETTSNIHGTMQSEVDAEKVDEA